MNFAFTGCSFTTGVGLNNKSEGFPNLVADHFSSLYSNVGKTGNSNEKIFVSSLRQIAQKTCDILVIQWTEFHRLWLHPGPDSELVLLPKIKFNYQYRDINFSQSELQHLSNTLMILNNDYHYVEELISYCQILENLANQSNIKLVFVNGLLPWTDDLYNKNISQNYMSNLSQFSKNMLDVSSRDDWEIDKLFSNLQHKALLLTTSLWVNQFTPFIKLGIDQGTDGIHPGPKSNQLYANMIIEHIKNRFNNE